MQRIYKVTESDLNELERLAKQLAYNGMPPGGPPPPPLLIAQEIQAILKRIRPDTQQHIWKT